MGRERQGDFVSAEVMDPHPGRPKMSTEKGNGMQVKAGNDIFILSGAGLCTTNPFGCKHLHTGREVYALVHVTGG